jgi:hypothetical protein
VQVDSAEQFTVALHDEAGRSAGTRVFEPFDDDFHSIPRPCPAHKLAGLPFRY